MDKKALQQAKKTGALGEQYAARYLIAQGYEVLNTNFHSKFGEIDIVARKNNEIIFCEVKTRKNINFGLPQEAFNYKKYSRIKKTIFIYFQNNRTNYSRWRIDLVSILLNSFDEVKELVHYRGV